MKTSKTKLTIENFFEKTGYWLFHNPKKVLFALFTIIGLLISQLPMLTIDTSVEALLHKDDPSIRLYDEFRDEFGREECIVIAIKSDQIFTNEFLVKLKKLHKKLESGVPHIKTVNSLVNARETYGQNDTIFVEKLLERWPENGLTVHAIKEKVFSNPMYVDNMISHDGKYTIITIETLVYSESAVKESVLADFEDDGFFDSGENSGNYLSVEENNEIITAINNIVKAYEKPGFEIFIAGAPVVTDSFNTATIKDAGLTTILALAAITFFLILLFRRVSGVFLAWLVVLSSLFCVYGIMAFFKIPVKLTTTIIPSFLLAVGVGDSVHILTIFFRKFKEGYRKDKAIAYALKHSGLAIVMTSVTTAAGLLSFSIADLAAISDVGVFAAAGVILALIFSIFMIPPFLALLPIKPHAKGGGAADHSFADKILLGFASFSEKHAWKIVFFCGFLLIVSVLYSSKLNFSHDTIQWFPDSMAVKNHIEVIDREFRGSVSLEVILDTEKENGLYNYELLRGIDKASDEIEKISSRGIKAGKVISINDITKEINKALYNNDDTYYVIPGDDKKIAENLFLFECSSSDDLEKISDSKMSKTRITIKTPSVDAVAYEGFINKVERIFKRNFSEDVSILITGMTSLLSRTITATLTSMTKSYFAAFVVITFMMVFLVGDIKLGLVSMVPNLLPIIVATGFMGYSGIPMDMCTIMVGSIAMGLVVDDTVHFMYNFHKYYNETGSGTEAVRETLLGTGRALLFTTLILSSGFYVVMFASLKHTVRFGFLLGSIILLALAADFFLASAIVILMTRKKEKREKQLYKADPLQHPVQEYFIKSKEYTPIIKE